MHSADSRALFKARRDVAGEETPRWGVKGAHLFLRVLDLTQRHEFRAAMYLLATPGATTQLSDSYP
jgi:hypothetical protein